MIDFILVENRVLSPYLVYVLKCRKHVQNQLWQLKAQTLKRVRAPSELFLELWLIWNKLRVKINPTNNVKVFSPHFLIKK